MRYNQSIIKSIWSQHKRIVLLVAFSIIFLITLFVLKNKTIYKNSEQNSNLAYSTEILGNLITRDTDGDEVLDWEETLWGTDPNKKDTNDDGVPDGVEIAKLKAEQGELSLEEGSAIREETLTETDKFSRELLSTIATLSQSGEIDQATIDQISNSLAEKIKNPVIRKVYLLSDLKIIKDDSVQAIKNYNDNLNNIFKKYPVKRPAIDVLQDLMSDENNINIDTLEELNSINQESKRVINDLIRINTPQYIATSHLDVINGLQRLSENMDDIMLLNTDVIVALSGITQYETNFDLLEKTIIDLTENIEKGLNN